MARKKLSRRKWRELKRHLVALNQQTKEICLQIVRHYLGPPPDSKSIVKGKR